MALKRPTPKALTAEAQETILSASARQTGFQTVVKTYDSNYPVFEVPVNQKVLVYIPNHTIMRADGTVSLRMDKFAAHPILDGRSYGDVRCSQGVEVAELGLDGTCPLCDAMRECWELYNKEYADVAKSKGIDPQSPEAQDALKQDRIDLVKAMVVKQAEVWYTFPIVVIDCEEKDGQKTVTPKKNENGQVSGTVMWYSIRERTYLEKWNAGFDSIETATGETPTTPAGLWAVLNFTYTPKSGNHDKMGSAKALKVIFKEMAGYEAVAQYFDNLTVDWTPAKAQEVLVLDAVRDMEEMKQVTDTLMKGTRDKLALYALGGGATATAPAISAQPADAALAAFGGAVQTGATEGAAPSLVGEMPNVGVQ